MAARSREDDELRKLSVEMRFLEQTAETLQSRIGMVNAAMTDLSYASATLEGLEKEKAETEMLVPIGGSSYVKVRLAGVDRVVLGVGAGVSVEKPVGEARAVLRARFEELQKSAVSAQQQFAQIAERINTGRSRLESLLSAREGKASANV